MTVSDRDRGARALARVYGQLRAGDRVAEVGVIGQRAAASEGPGVTVADVATWMEYISYQGQPPRSWLRAWIDGHRPEIDRRIREEVTAVHRGTITRDQALARLGVWLAGQLQQNIANGIAPANAPSTIERKGSSTPLVDKGQFRQSISSRIANS